MQQMTQIQTMMMQMQTQLQNQQQPPPAPTRAPTDRTRRNRDKYCWTHGAGNHNGHGCTRPAVGHEKEATFDNKMGGSQRHYKNH